MAYPSQQTEVKVSSQAADSFVTAYYRDLNEHRSLSSFYVNSSSRYSGAGITADISINGAHVSGPADYEALLDEQRGVGSSSSSGGAAAAALKVRYEVDGYDSQVLNNDYGLACPAHLLAKGPDRTGGRISVLVTVVGVVHLGSGPDPLRKRFHDRFVLVPNWDARGRNPPRNARKFLISSHNYRTL